MATRMSKKKKDEYSEKDVQINQEENDSDKNVHADQSGVNLTFPFGASMSEAERAELAETHPIRERGYLIPTVALEKAYDIVRDRVGTRRSGLVFYAMPRVGKTTATEYILSELQEEFPKVYTQLMDARASLQPSNSHLPKLILEGRSHAAVVSGRGDELLSNVIADTAVKLLERRGNVFVLIIDEAQLLSSHDWQQLLVIQNILVRKKIRLVSISFGQPDILQRISALLIAKKQQILQRFLADPVAFEACGSAFDLRDMLKVYDEESEYPEGSGLSYTCFFLPLAFSRGFRLAKYAEKIWGALCDAAVNIPGNVIPMEHLSLTIESILFVGAENDALNFVLAQKDIEEAVRSSGLSGYVG